MKIIDTDAVESHGTVMIIFDAASIAYRAVVHPGEFIYLAFHTEPPSRGWLTHECVGVKVPWC
jgi:hypothetical protein